MRLATCIVSFVFLVSGVFAFGETPDTSWYMSATSGCMDPYALSATINNGVWFHKYPDLHFVSVSEQIAYAVVTKPDYDSLVLANKAGLISESHSLSAAEASVVRGKLYNDSTNAVVPVAFDVISLLISYVGSPGSFGVSKALAGGFIKYLLSRDSAAKVSARTLSEVMADGGTFSRLLRIGTDQDHRSVLIDATVYDVRVGNEQRRYVPLSCTYPVKVVFSEFHTDAQSNNKIYRRVSGTRWQVIDVDMQKLDDTLFEVRRDDTFLYLSENDPNSRINDAFRISLNGGPFQRDAGGIWQTLYSQTHAVR
jgi:hypothetical protein